MNDTVNTIGNFILSGLDKVSNGISSYYDARTVYDQTTANIQNAQRQYESQAYLTDLSTGNSATNWSNPAEPTVLESVGLNVEPTQAILIAGALGLIAFAVVKGK